MRRGLILVLATLPLFFGACVSKNTFQQKVNEADLLSRDVAELTSTVATLRQEKTSLQNDLSSLNARLVNVLQQNSKLQKDLLAAYATQERQEGNLSLHQQQIEAMRDQLADMQQTNDQLLTTIEELMATIKERDMALEKEKIAREARLAKVKNTYDQLVGALEDEIQRGELTISNLEGKLSVSLLNNILFDSGKTVIKKEGQKVLKSLGDVLNKFPDKALQIEGHTDNVKISSRLIEKYPTNWELSTARSTSVVHFLQDKVGLPGERLVAAGYSEYSPVSDNETPEGRAQNRRIQILLVPFKATPPAQ